MLRLVLKSPKLKYERAVPQIQPEDFPPTVAQLREIRAHIVTLLINEKDLHDENLAAAVNADQAICRLIQRLTPREK